MLFFIGFQDSFGVVEVFLWFPGVVSGGKSFPFNKEGVASSLLLVGDYGFNFILVFSFDKVRGVELRNWFCECCSLCRGIEVSGQPAK